LHHYFAFFQTIRDAILSDINLSLLEHQLRSYEQQQPINDELQSGVTESSQSETNILSCDQKQTVMDELQSCDVVWKWFVFKWQWFLCCTLDQVHLHRI